MTFEQAQEKALQYAKKNKFSTIRKAGERDGFWYFRLVWPTNYGHYLGLPLYVKINRVYSFMFQLLQQLCSKYGLKAQ